MTGRYGWTNQHFFDFEDLGPTCRVCGCLDESACVEPASGLACSWAEEDICSFCAADEAEERKEAVSQ